MKTLPRILRRVLLIGGLVVLAAGSANASSHREAPFITELPKVDGTDFYMFNSYEPGRQGYVTFIANYQPFQVPYGGPNFFTLDPDALYEIHIDNSGDAREDLTFQFRFKNTLQDLSVNVGGKKISVPLANIGPISPGNTQALNVIETYTIDLVRGNRRTGNRQPVINAGTGSTTFTKPADNFGAKSIPNYEAYARTHIASINIPGCSAGAGNVFVGQRVDPFFINLGEIFDLVNLNPVGPPNAKRNILEDENVTSFVLEVPAACLTRDANSPTIGAWTTASLRQGRLLRPTPTYERPALEGGAWTQVSRLAMPLVNEIVIGLKDKDKFNASKPEDDAQFADYVRNPAFPALIEALFPVAKAPTQFPRADLEAAFLTGVKDVNQITSTPTASEMMRLNTAIQATAQAGQNNLGAALCFVNGVLTLTNPGCDPAGFPNGRRPGDDVVDIELRVAMGYLLPPAVAPAGQLPLTDGATISAKDFDNAFPYLRTPVVQSPQQ